jgi:hypothetical protein
VGSICIHENPLIFSQSSLPSMQDLTSILILFLPPSLSLLRLGCCLFLPFFFSLQYWGLNQDHWATFPGPSIGGHVRSWDNCRHPWLPREIWRCPVHDVASPFSFQNFQTRIFPCRVQGSEANFLFLVLNLDLSSWPGDICGSRTSIQWVPVFKMLSHLGDSACCPHYLILLRWGKMTQTQEQIRKWVIPLSTNCHLMPLPSRLLGEERN